MKRFAVAVLAVLFVLSLTVSAAAAPPGLEKAKAKWEDGKPGNAQAAVQAKWEDGKPGAGKALGLAVGGKAKPWGDVPPVIKEGRVLIPVRGMMAALGAQVDWDAEAKTVTITLGEDVLVIDFGELDENGLPTFSFNGELIDGPDVPPMNINGRIVLPLRFIAETFGLLVDYDGQAGEVRIGKGKPPWAGADDEDEEDEDEDEEEDEEDEDDDGIEAELDE